MQLLKRVARGEAITADWANALVDEVERLSKLRGVSPIVVEHHPAGSQVRMDANLQSIALFRLHSVKGTTVDNVTYWNARQVRVDDDGYSEATSHTHVVYDPLRLVVWHVVRLHPAFYNSSTGRWEVLAPMVGAKWAKAIQDWQNSTQPYVLCYPCQDSLGSGVDASITISIALPRPAGGRDPNVHEDDIIAYVPAGGEFLCVSPYLDDKLQTVKPFTGSLVNIPPGWALADGVQNSTTKGGSGFDLSGRFIVAFRSGHPQYGTVGSTGGSDSHQHPAAAGHNHTLNLATTEVQPGATIVATLASGTTGTAGAHQHDAADHRPPYFVLAYLERVH